MQFSDRNITMKKLFLAKFNQQTYKLQIKLYLRNVTSHLLYRSTPFVLTGIYRTRTRASTYWKKVKYTHIRAREAAKANKRRDRKDVCTLNVVVARSGCSKPSAARALFIAEEKKNIARAIIGVTRDST